jgi:hypothetical protein
VSIRYVELLKDDNTHETDSVDDMERLRPPLGPWLARQRATRLEVRARARACAAAIALPRFRARAC